jgi:hypothetical protein
MTNNRTKQTIIQVNILYLAQTNKQTNSLPYKRIFVKADKQPGICLHKRWVAQKVKQLANKMYINIIMRITDKTIKCTFEWTRGQSDIHPTMQTVKELINHNYN